jgi:histidine triad (HIT) family protein
MYQPQRERHETMNPDCVFCRIVAGEIPSTRVYEDAEILAFMDIGPLVKGHTLVIPKAHWDPITDIPLPLLQKVIAVVQKVAQAQKASLRADGINVTQANGRTAGQIVPHLHFHVIPRFATDGYHFNWLPKKYDNVEEMEEMGARIKAAMEVSTGG